VNLGIQLSLMQALLLLGAVVLLIVLLHGWWTTRRAKGPATKLATEAQPTGFAAQRQEPSLGATAEGDDTQPELSALRHAPRRQPRLDALIDALVPLALDSPVTGDAVLAHLPPSRRAGGKPFYIEGLDTETAEWEAPVAGRRYGELQAGVQMANRGGAINEIEYSEFVQKVQAFADALDATPDAPDMLDVVKRARELDAMASPLDAQLTLTLRSSSVAWSVGYIHQCAARHGFVLGAVPGRMVVPATESGAPPVLSLSIDPQVALAALAQDSQDGQGRQNGQAGESEYSGQDRQRAAGTPAAAVREFTLTLDVPQTAREAEPFPAWHRAATALADDMDATVVDDHGQALPVAAFASIAQELAGLYDQLDRLDLSAGSPAARRLFS